MQNKKLKQTFIWLTIFAIAMGFMESAIVIYMRELYYPEGFEFPLKMMSNQIAFVELIREAATIIMLIILGILSGRTKTEKFGFFLFGFAIWDIFYYVFLKLILNWPESFFTWDILFLIPLTWVGPVICPILLSVSMIALAILISVQTTNSKSFVISKSNWILLISGSLVVILSFVWEYAIFMLKEFKFFELFDLAKFQILLERGIQFIPVQFPWGIFSVGFIIIVFPTIRMSIKINPNT